MRKSILAGGGVVALMLAIALLVQRCMGAPPDVPHDASRAPTTPPAAAGRG